jgi:hypothetical protein
LDADGNVYVTGSSFGAGNDADYATIRYDAAGNPVWVMRYDGPAHGLDRATSVAVDADGNVFVTGESLGIYDSGTLPAFPDYATIKYRQGR